MKFDIISLFSDAMRPYYDASILGRAQRKKLISITMHDLRQWAINKHGHVDDTPYGGGPGMVIRVDVVHKALQSIYKRRNKRTRVVLLTPRGKTFTQKDAIRLMRYDRVILIAGRYEAIDARIDNFIDEKISIGNFILTGGELAAACVVDSVSRLIPDVLGDAASLHEESFSTITKDAVHIEYPQHTRPEVYKGLRVPDVLLSGNHASIRAWRNRHKKKRTR